VAGAAGSRGKFSIDKGPEDAFGLWVGLLVPVVGPDLLGEGKLGGGEFADGGGGHGVMLLAKGLEEMREKGRGRGNTTTTLY